MSTLAALALVILTPFFGFALTPPGAPGPVGAPPGSLLNLPVFPQLSGDDGDDEQPLSDDAEADEAALDEAAPEEEAAAGEAAPAPTPAEAAEAALEDDAAPSEPDDMANYAAQLRQRQEIGGIHRAFGIATWGSLLVTGVLGFIQYYNLYGFFGSREDTPCVQGNAVFGQDQCWGVPWAHRISALTATALYTTTFILSFTMPDPDNLSSGTSAYAQNLQMHKTLRWVHMAGMLAQLFLGFATAQNWFGIDRANDFGAQQALASVHQLIGWTTIGVVTAAGAIMIF